MIKITTSLYKSEYRFAFRYLAGFLPAILVLYGNLHGGIASSANMVFTLGLLVLIDLLLPNNSSQNPELDHAIPDLWLILAVVVNVLCFGSLLNGIGSGQIAGSHRWTAAISTGLNSGLLGLNTAHELIHRKQRFFRFLGVCNLFVSFYSHFFIEHRLGHHARVATEKDPATARLGEGFYRFLVRTIPGQWWSALQIELRKPSLKIGDHRFNFVLSTGLLQFGFFAVLFYLGKWLAFAYLLQSLVAIFLLEYVNYIEHYGLLRNDGEKLSAIHAWQSDSIASRFSLFELSRHSHHHLQASVPYPELESMESPHRLPFGYFGMFYIALCPPLWFWMMDKRIVHYSLVHANTIA